MLALGLSMFMASLDQTVVSVAIPTIAAEFHSLQDVSWIGAAYFLTWTAFQGVYGKCSSIFGYKIMILFALFFFLVGSLICALANSMVMLIVGRAIAGIGGAGIQSLTQIIITVVCPVRRRGMYQGLAGLFYMIGTAIGPLIGGAFTDHLGWRWAFYINLPLGAVSALAVVLVLRNQPAPGTTWKERFSRVDYLGLVLLLAWVIILLLPLSWGGSTYPWNSPIIIVLFCLFAVLLALFLWVQWRIAKEPLMPLSVFIVHRNPVLIFMANLCMGMCLTGFIYYVPIIYQEGMGDSATTSGVKFIPYMVSTIVMAIITGILISVTLRYRPFAAMGPFIASIGTGLVTTWTLSTSTGMQVGCLILSGAGTGAFVVSALFSAQAPTKKEDLPVTTSLVSFFRSLGGVIGVALFGTIFNNTLPKLITQAIPNIDPASMTAILEGDKTVMSTYDQATQLLIRQASMEALKPVFYTTTALFCLAGLLVLATAHVPLSKEDFKKLKETKD
ncbi:major facilitator superfamily-domain-containing protein [Umbelopsis sp. AD052]|nr:major facilitator superfamily-domain-containing protein [Umbelopsis sp. AD052]